MAKLPLLEGRSPYISQITVSFSRKTYHAVRWTDEWTSRHKFCYQSVLPLP